MCTVALLLAGAPGHANAQTTQGSIASTRAEIDATANKWFAAQREAADLDVQIATLTKTLTQIEHRVKKVRRVAGDRAVALYESDTQALSGVMGGDVMGGDPLELGRRAALIGQANANGQVAIDELEAAIGDLHARQRELHKAQAAQSATLRDLAGRRRTLDNQLGSLQLAAAGVSDSSHPAAKIRRPDEPATTAPPTRSAVALASQPLPVAATPAADPSPPPPPAEQQRGQPPSRRTRSSCAHAPARAPATTPWSARAGYYGAYQFAPTTWNVTATHIGRLDLVGASPNQASEYDQDEMAWALYNWQGNSPWGGRC